MDEIERRPNIIVSAPNQNHEYFNNNLERLVPYFAARSLNRIVSMNQGIKPLNIDMWNNFGHSMDQEYKNQTQFDGVSREEYSALLIAKKYKFLEEIGIDTTHNEIVCDDDKDTIDWMSLKVSGLFEDGIIYEDIESVNVCANCGNIIAISTANVSLCRRCNSTDIYIEKRKTLFVDLPGNKIDYIRGKIELPKKSNFINGQFATLPGRIMIARKRDYGQPLGIPGYEDMVLDPKIGLALMPEMIANRYNIDTITQVQGATTAKNTAPYTSVLSPDLIARYIFTSNIPSNINEKRLNSFNTDFFTKYLPIYMLDRANNLDEMQLQSLCVEHSKVRRKIENAIYYLTSNKKDALLERPKDISKLVEAIGSIANYNVRCGVINMRKFIFEDLGGQYIKSLREHKAEISSDSIRDIETILKEVF